MKRKSPDNISREGSSKRRKLNQESETPQSFTRDEDFENEETEIISPLTDITNTANKISPRPPQLITKQLQKKRILLQTKHKSITLTDDEHNIIHEEDEEDNQEFDDENEIEVARGTDNENKKKNQDFDFLTDEEEFDPFNPATQEIINRKSREHQSSDQFETISGLIGTTKYMIIIININMLHITEERMFSIDEYEHTLNDELDLSQLLLSQTDNINISENDDDQSMNMSLPLSLHDDTDSVLTEMMKQTTISVEDKSAKPSETESQASPDQEEVLDLSRVDLIPSPFPVITDTDKTDSDKAETEMIQRTAELEEDEKAIELLDETLILPTPQSQQAILSETVGAPPKDDIIILPKPKKMTYSMQKQKRRQELRKQHEIEEAARKKKERERQSIIDHETDLLIMTPITRQLREELSKSLLKPSTRSRRRQRGRKRDKIQILPSEIELLEQERERQRILQREQERDRERKRRSRIRAQTRPHRRGRTWSLMDKFERERLGELEAEIEADLDFDGDSSVINEEDEMREMILRQSGLSQQWEEIEKERKKKRQAARRRLARHAKRRRREMGISKRTSVITRAPPKIDPEIKKRETAVADFWRGIEEKVENGEGEEDIEDDRDNNVITSGRRAKTPPRIAKQLERRYRKLYENGTGELVELPRKRRGKRVWFCKQKMEVLNDKQGERYDLEMNNSLISVTPSPPPTPEPVVPDIEIVDDSMMMMQDLMSLPPMSTPSTSIMSSISGVSTIVSTSSRSSKREDKRKMSEDDSVLRGIGISIDWDGISKMDKSVEAQKQQDDDYGSVVSGHLLPSVTSLPSILERDDEPDMDEVDDPFFIENRNEEGDDRISHIIHSGSSQSQSIAD